jgi:UDP-N-acetylglucosamine 2-epimerase (non-hydrolysing)
VPCLTLRSNTERPITIGEGTNTLVGTDRELLLKEVDEIVVSGGKRGRVPEYWDGRAAERIASHLAAWLASDGGRGGIGKAGPDGRAQSLRVA